MIVLVNVIKPQGLEPLQFPTKFRSHSDEAQAFTDRFQSTLAQRPSTLNLEAVGNLADMPELATEDANAQP